MLYLYVLVLLQDESHISFQSFAFTGQEFRLFSMYAVFLSLYFNFGRCEEFNKFILSSKKYIPGKENKYVWLQNVEIFVLQVLTIGSYRCMMVRFLHWHYLVLPNQLCSLLLKNYLAAVEQNMEMTFNPLIS